MSNGPTRQGDSSGESSDDQSDDDTVRSELGDFSSTDSSLNGENEDRSTGENSTEESEATVGGGGGSAVQVGKPNSDRNAGEQGDSGRQNETEGLEVEITVYTDPWDAVGWGNEPELRYLEEMFDGQLEVSYAVLSPRTTNDLKSDDRMPVASDIDTPDSTSASSRALFAARRQGMTREYLRRLRIAALSEGYNIENDAILIELAEEIELDIDRLREDMSNTDLDEPVSMTVPRIEADIDGAPHEWTGQVEGDRIFARIIGTGIEEQPREFSVERFVSEYSLVETAEVAEGLDIDEDRAADKLQQSTAMNRRALGVGMFWSA
jgi:hypothetical protein